MQLLEKNRVQLIQQYQLPIRYISLRNPVFVFFLRFLNAVVALTLDVLSW